MLSSLVVNHSVSSKFDAMVLWLGSVKTHRDVLPNVLFWWEIEMVAAKDTCLAALQV